MDFPFFKVDSFFLVKFLKSYVYKSFHRHPRDCLKITRENQYCKTSFCFFLRMIKKIAAMIVRHIAGIANGLSPYLT